MQKVSRGRFVYSLQARQVPSCTLGGCHFCLVGGTLFLEFNRVLAYRPLEAGAAKPTLELMRCSRESINTTITQIAGFQGPKTFQGMEFGTKTLLFGHSDPLGQYVNPPF